MAGNRTVDRETVSQDGRNYEVSLNYWPDHKTRGFYVSVWLLGLNGEKITTNCHSSLIFGCKRYSKTAEMQAKTFYEDGKKELMKKALEKEIKH